MTTHMMKNNQKFISYEQDEDIDQSIWERSKIVNNSGYLPEQYEITREFPTIPEYHFRVEDQQTILQLQKELQISQLQKQKMQKKPFHYQNHASDKFQDKMNSLLLGLDSANKSRMNDDNLMMAENKMQSHGFYMLKDEYDDQGAIRQAYNRLKINQIQEKMAELSLKDKPFKAKFVKKDKTQVNNIKIEQDKQKNAAPSQKIIKISKQFKKLSIREQDM